MFAPTNMLAAMATTANIAKRVPGRCDFTERMSTTFLAKALYISRIVLRKRSYAEE